MREELAIIRRPGYGARDFRDGVGLWFDVEFGRASGALICMFGDEAAEVLKNVYDVSDLDGKPCFVEVDNGIVRFKGLR